MTQTQGSPGLDGTVDGPRVVVCGDSLPVSAIAEVLQKVHGLRVSHWRSRQSDAGEQISALAPAAVIVDQQAETVELLLALLQRSIPIIGLDAEGSDVRVWRSCRVPVTSLEELEAVIQRVKG